MIYVACALFKEAEPLIKCFELKNQGNKNGISVFSDDKIKLIITGSGNVPAAISLTRILSEETILSGDAFINFGSAAASFDNTEIFICNKLTESTTGRTFYPDLLYTNGLKEREIITAPVPVKEVSKDSKALYDMEAASLYQVAVRWFKQDKMFFIKYISDNGASGIINISASEKQVNMLKDFIKGLESDDERERLTSEIKSLSEYVSEYFAASETMKTEIYNILLYKQLLSGDAKESVEKFFLDNNILEPLIRRDGKRMLIKLVDTLK